MGETLSEGLGKYSDVFYLIPPVRFLSGIGKT